MEFYGQVIETCLVDTNVYGGSRDTKVKIALYRRGSRAGGEFNVVVLNESAKTGEFNVVLNESAKTEYPLGTYVTITLARREPAGTRQTA